MINEGDRVLNGRYELLRQVKASLGGGRVELGRKGRCRFCGRGREAPFRKIAHTFPEAMGNKWVISLDECDDCNAKFSLYEGALASGVAPLLTLGGVKGKGNRIRQTGRSSGPSVLRRESGGDRPRISVRVSGHELGSLVGVEPSTERLRLKMPVAGVPFRPRHAYKALCKMAIALLPETEIGHYDKLRAWLQDADDTLEFPLLDVALSIGSIGNAPPLAVGTLLRRTDPGDFVPHILFLFSAGSVCLQIDLMSDQLEDDLPPTPMGAVNIRWTNVIGGDEGQTPIRIDYGDPVHLNWATLETQPQPIEAVVLDFDPRTTEGRFTPLLRS